MPTADRLRRAVAWFAAARTERPDEHVTRTVDRACLQFDLDPAESEWLLRNALRLEKEGRERRT